MARTVENAYDKSTFMGFNPAVSKNATNAMREKKRSFRWHFKTGLELKDIAKSFNPVLRGWINYYGKYYLINLKNALQHFTRILVKWVMRKYKRFRGKKIKAIKYLTTFIENNPNLFAHWKIGITRVVV